MSTAQYQGKVLDLSVVVNDCLWLSNATSGFIAFGTTAIEHTNRGFKWVDMTWQFLEHGTTTPVAVSGFMIINDIHWTQYIQFSTATS